MLLPTLACVERATSIMKPPILANPTARLTTLCPYIVPLILDAFAMLLLSLIIKAMNAIAGQGLYGIRLLRNVSAQMPNPCSILPLELVSAVPNLSLTSLAVNAIVKLDFIGFQMLSNVSALTPKLYSMCLLIHASVVLGLSLTTTAGNAIASRGLYGPQVLKDANASVDHSMMKLIPAIQAKSTKRLSYK